MLMLGLLPAALDWLIVALISKTDGGERPICIFPSPLRLMSKLIRGSYGKHWATKQDRPYLFGKKGKSALACVWRKSLFAEFAVYVGLSAAASLLDIAKAFDSFDHVFLMQQAIRHGFDLGVLRFVLTLYCTNRIIEVQGVATTPKRAVRSIVPGDSMADLFMTLCLLSAVDKVVKNYPSAHPAVLADDTQLLVYGSESHCSRTLADATKMLIEELEGGCLLTVSTEKLAVVASTKTLKTKIGKRYPRLKEAANKSARNL